MGAGPAWRGEGRGERSPRSQRGSGQSQWPRRQPGLTAPLPAPRAPQRTGPGDSRPGWASGAPHLTDRDDVAGVPGCHPGLPRGDSAQFASAQFAFGHSPRKSLLFKGQLRRFLRKMDQKLSLSLRELSCRPHRGPQAGRRGARRGGRSLLFSPWPQVLGGVFYHRWPRSSPHFRIHASEGQEPAYMSGLRKESPSTCTRSVLLKSTNHQGRAVA